MTIFVTALLSAVIAGFNPKVSDLRDNFGGWAGGWLLRAVIFLLCYWGIYYFVATPLFVGTIMGLVGMIFVGFLINCVITGLVSSNDMSNDENGAFLGAGTVVGGAMLLWLAVGGIGGCDGFHTDMLVKQIGQMKSVDLDRTYSPTNPDHIRFVSKEQAVFWMNKLMGQEVPGRKESVLGSSYEIDYNSMRIQKVKDHLYWVAPLKFSSYWRWKAEDGKVPYFAIMSAESPDARPELKEIQGMQYMNTAAWDFKLDRHLRNAGYSNVILTDFAFEVNDDLKPFWVISIVEPREFGQGQAVKGVLVLDPVSGKYERFALDKLPSWIDCAIPAETATHWVSSWGMLRRGWWNSMFGKVDALEPVGEPIEIFGDDGQIYWHIGLSSANNADSALAGFVHVNTRTGAPKYFRLKDPASHSSDVIKAAVTALRNGGLLKAEPTEPIPYVLYGRLAYVFPVIGGNNTFERLCIVDSMNPDVVAIGERVDDTFREFKALLNATPGNTVVTSEAAKEKTLTGVVKRIGTEIVSGRTVFVILLNDNKVLYRSSSANGPELPLTKEGDRVTIVIADTSENETPLKSFDNLELN